MNPKQPLSVAALAGYGLLAMPLAFAGLPLYVNAPDYYATNHGLSLGLMGIILLVVRIIDAVQDPLIGIWSDRLAPRRTLLMMVSLAVLVGSFLLLYAPPPILPPAFWFTVSLIIATFGFSIVSINFNAIGSLWSIDPNEKTRITGMRELFGLVGLFLATIAPPLLQKTVAKTEIYTLYAWLFAAMVVVTGGVFMLWQQRLGKAIATQATAPLSLSSSWRIILQPELRRFYAIYAASVLSSSIPAVLVVFFIRDKLGAESQTGLFLCLYFTAAIAGIPVWRKLSARYGKATIWLAAMLLALVSFGWSATLQEGAVIAYGIICVLSGFTLGAELMLPPSIASDLLDQHHLTHRTASVFAALHFLSKAALALATGISFLILDVAGYQPAQQNTPQSLLWLGLVYALLPSIIKLVAVMLLRKSINSGI